MKLREIGEFGFIDRIAAKAINRGEGVVKGIGDDCAVIDVGVDDYLLVTTDLLVERVHFQIGWYEPKVLGAKALVSNLSDIAACGGTPRDAFVSLAIPEDMEIEWLDGFYEGMAKVATKFRVNILGGDTSSSKTDFMVSITVTGIVPKKEVLFRDTAKPGELIVVTGPLGESAAGCEILLKGISLDNEESDKLVKAHLQPQPHIEQARMLAASGACSAAIDVSDGLSSDLGHVCMSSKVGALIYEKSLPISNAVIKAGETLGKNPLDWVLNGGEDYILLVAVKPQAFETIRDDALRRRFNMFRIGEFVEGQGVDLEDASGRIRKLAPGGWNHFSE
jgi:thiamine-monophosphate kinase